jgi:hypothetical protein
MQVLRNRPVAVKSPPFEGRGAVSPRSLTVFEMTDPVHCCHSERASEESFFALGFAQTQTDHYPFEGNYQFTAKRDALEPSNGLAIQVNLLQRKASNH